MANKHEAKRSTGHVSTSLQFLFDCPAKNKNRKKTFSGRAIALQSIGRGAFLFDFNNRNRIRTLPPCPYVACYWVTSPLVAAFKRHSNDEGEEMKEIKNDEEDNKLKFKLVK